MHARIIPRWFIRHCENWKAYSFNNLLNYWRGLGIGIEKLKSIRDELHERSDTNIAVIGSVGKTTVVKILAQLLQNAGCPTFYTKVNDNWLPKAPLASYLALKKNYSFRIFECAATKRGDMRALSFLIPSKYIIFTEFTNAHLAEFKNLGKIIKEKLSFISYSKKCFIVSHVNNKEFLEQNNIRAIYFGENGSGAEFSFSDVKTSINRTTFNLHRPNGEIIFVKISGFGAHLPCAAISAIAMFEILTGRQINRNNLRALMKFKPIMRRMEIVHRRNIRFIVDTANANRISILNSLRSFLGLSNVSPKCIILDHFSGMGPALNGEVKKLSKEILKLPISKLSKLYLVGNEFMPLYECLSKRILKTEIKIFSGLNDAKKNIKLADLRDHTVLLRGPSRGKKNLVLLIPQYRNYSNETSYIRK